jgi:tRNA(His) guanylyltransferase
MSHDSLGDRMKEKYEKISHNTLTGRMPTIIRVDGRAFHTLTKNRQKPFDDYLMDCMNRTAIALCKEIQGACISYVQSDEISVLINDYKKLGSESWFGKDVQKMVSISAAVASVAFSCEWNKECYESIEDFQQHFEHIHFDSRAFILPEREVNNYFHWRQQDWERNSIQMVTRSHYSHKEMSNKKIPDMHEMLYAKGINWNDFATQYKRGRCAYKGPNGWQIDNEIPIFKNDHYYIEQHLQPEEE